MNDAAKYLGVSYMTVRRLVSRGLLRPNKAFRLKLFSVEGLNKFIEEGAK